MGDGDDDGLSIYLRETLMPREVRVTAGRGLIRVLVGRESLADAARALAGPLEARLLTAMGRDQRREHGAFTIHYLFRLPRHHAYVDLVAELPPSDPSFPSLAALLPAAGWPEREARDLLGLLPVDHPNPAPLLHREGWPSDYYPLRSDAPSVPPTVVAAGDARISEVARMGTLIGMATPLEPGADHVHDVPMEAPTQPTHIDAGVGSSAETIRLFYGHRGIERLCEGRSLAAAQALIERVCGSCATAHALAFCQAVEAAAGIDVPAAARSWRVALLEIERARAHLGWVGALYAAAGRAEGGSGATALIEPLLALTEALTGDRRATGALRPGGLPRAIPAMAATRAREALGSVRARWEGVRRLLLQDEVMAGRLRDRATLPRRTAEHLGTVGPMARAAGLERDCRPSDPATGSAVRPAGANGSTRGDAAARLHVHLEEVTESLRMLDPLLAAAPAGMHSAPIGRPRAGAEGIGRVEAAEGEHLHWLILGPSLTVERLHIRSAAYACWPAALEILASAAPSDFELDLASFGLCTACADR